MVAANVDRTVMARALNLERVLLRGLLESSADAVSFKDAEGRFVRLNSRKASRLGCDLEGCLGKTEADITGRDDVETLDRAAMAAGQVDEQVFEEADPDRGTRWTSVTRTPLGEAGGRASYLMTSERDITEARFTEARLRQSEKMQALGTLAGGIAHDFNNLLTAIIGSLDLAERRLPEDERLRRYVTGARSAAERGAVLTKRLLGFSRQTDQRNEASDVNAVVARMRDLLDHSLGGTVRVEWSLEASKSWVQVDPEQLELAILNLCVNARDAMPEGGTVRILTQDVHLDADNPAQLGSGAYVAVTVADEGVGIPPDVLARVFEPFFTTKDLGKGTGLGLSMVYTLATQAGGDVSVDSVLGSGTRVTIRLPAIEAVQRPSAVAAERTTPQVRPARLLVVDDDPAVRAVTVAYASALGHGVREAASGPEALEILQSGSVFDLLVVDYAMPAMTGVEFVERTRALRMEMPVLYVTGHAEAEALDAMDHYLPKPFRQEDLGRAIASLLDRTRPPAAITSSARTRA